MLGAVYSEWIKSTHNLLVTGNAGNEKTEKYIIKSQIVINAVKMFQSKGIENDRQWGNGLF